MNNDIRKSEKGRTAYLNMGAWYDPETEQIHLTLPSSNFFHTTVNNSPSSVRCHKNLYGKLARVLEEAGVPYPEVS